MQSVYPWDYDAQSLNQVRDLFESAMYSTSINYLSLPAGIVPIGKASGLPTAIQVVGQRFREDLILDAMEIIERQVGIMAHELWNLQT